MTRFFSWGPYTSPNQAAALAFTPAWAGDASADAADARASAASATVKDTRTLGSSGARQHEIVGGVNDGLGWSGGK